MRARPTRPSARGLLAALALLAVARPATAAGLAPATERRIDQTVAEVLKTTGAPSASIAIVYQGAIAFSQAYGCAHLRPCVPAKPAMRYAIGSLSKEFTATALLLLEQEGRLSLEDRVAKYFPAVARGADISIRALLSHTSGIADFWPQDFVLSTMAGSITPEALIERYTSGPLDFEPGTRWQYSNTGYTIAGAIAEQVAGEPLVDYLRKKIFVPLGMTSVIDVDRGHLAAGDPAPYTRYALGPARESPATGQGWLYGAGELGLTAADLARWDRALMAEELLPAAVWRALEREVVLTDGAGGGYALGLHVRLDSGRRLLEHDGEVAGFGTFHRMYPEERLAVIVFTNLDASGAAAMITARLSELLLETTSAEERAALDRARATFAALQRGELRRDWFTEEGNRYFSEVARRDFARSLAPLGRAREFRLKRSELRGGFIVRIYHVRTAQRPLEITTLATPLGRFEQYTVAPE